MKRDIYREVTDRIVHELEQGVRPWIKPWDAGTAAGRIVRPLRHTGQAYSGINILMLWAAACTGGYGSPFWFTFKQAKDLDAHVRKGERGSPVVYANTITRTEQDENGEDIERDIPFMKAYTVFNAEQIAGLPESYYAQPPRLCEAPERIAHAEKFFANTGAAIRHGGGEAFYTQSRDIVQMPPIEAFRDAESYYSTLAHEVTHWTKAPHRLNRDFGRKRFGDEGYAREELVAELGAAFLAADLDLEPEPREDHAAYIGHWLEILRGDKRAIFTAAAHAQRAADYLHGFQDARTEAA